MRSAFDGFSPEALRFLAQLKRNNRRPWFLKNKETYEQQIKAPMIQLVQALNTELQSFAPEMVTEPKRAIYRIYRDIRFSKDKSPYKTHISALFAPRGSGKHACAGFYFHFSPEELLVAGGVYMPGPKELLAIRGHIAENSEVLRRMIANRQFKRLFGQLEGEALRECRKVLHQIIRLRTCFVTSSFLFLPHIRLLLFRGRSYCQCWFKPSRQ